MHTFIIEKLKALYRYFFNREMFESLVIALVLALIVQAFFIKAFKIPTGSMRMTLVEGDRILVNRLLYRFREPQRGDIIVFRSPKDQRENEAIMQTKKSPWKWIWRLFHRDRDFIKRLIGIGPEQIEIRNGDIYVDEKLVTNPAIKNTFYYNRGLYGQEYHPITVPEGEYYALGDNSAESNDSRYWGFVPRENMLGRAFFIYWPPSRIRVLK